MFNDIDIKIMIQWLGVDGTRAGLRGSKRLTLSELMKIAAAKNISYKSKITRNELIDLIILKYDKRIDKNFEELKKMSAADLAEYLDRTSCSKEEVMKLLDDNDLPYKKSESRSSLIRHAADQISGIGIFQRIAKNNE